MGNIERRWRIVRFNDDPRRDWIVPEGFDASIIEPLGEKVEVIEVAPVSQLRGAVERAEKAEALLRQILTGKHSLPGTLTQIERLLDDPERGR